VSRHGPQPRELARGKRGGGAPAGTAGGPRGLANQQLQLVFVGVDQLEGVTER